MRYLFLAVQILFILSIGAQDSTFARGIIKHLCADELHGRGYYKNGAKKAAKYLNSQMKEIGLEPIVGKSYHQPFVIEVNTIKNIELIINRKPGL